MRQRFIQSFSTSGTEQTAIDNKELGKPYVAYIEDGQYIDWNTKGIDYTGMPLTFEIISGGTVNWLSSSPNKSKTIEYQINDGSWNMITSTFVADETSTISVNDGDIVRFRGDNTTYSENQVFSHFGGSAFYNAMGNIMSLVQKDGFTSASTFGNEAFLGLFQRSEIIDASNLILPVLALTSKCYYAMFSDCHKLSKAPALPATTLAELCYSDMFRETNLEKAPELPALSLVNGCYGAMFYRARGLSYVKCLAENVPAGTLNNWLKTVSSTGTFVKHPNATWPSGESGIPTGWTVIDADI